VYELDSHGDHQGFINTELLGNWVDTTNSDVYYCGPKPFMAELSKCLAELNIEQERQHYEIFGPTTSLKEEQ